MVNNDRESFRKNIVSAPKIGPLGWSAKQPNGSPDPQGGRRTKEVIVRV
jgi:hypothetical protein